MQAIANNKKANYDYVIIDKIDAGLVLTGPEVKSLRTNSSSIKESYINAESNELWLCNCFIKKYESSSERDSNPTRKRKLLVNRKELNKIIGAVKKNGFTIIPLSMYFNDKGIVKISIGLGKGKKKYDKRESQKTKDWNKNKQRLLKNN
tara:strand:+ start:4042 stop:4488 length:447 start_codon:yes stop_codon:yes gene_type:complete